MTVHELKTVSRWYRAIATGAKTFELRRNDRDYQVGDTLVLREWNGQHTGQQIRRTVSYVLRAGECAGLVPGMVILGLTCPWCEVESG